MKGTVTIELRDYEILKNLSNKIDDNDLNMINNLLRECDF